MKFKNNVGFYSQVYYKYISGLLIAYTVVKYSKNINLSVLK